MTIIINDVSRVEFLCRASVPHPLLYHSVANLPFRVYRRHVSNIPRINDHIPFPAHHKQGYTQLFKRMIWLMSPLISRKQYQALSLRLISCIPASYQFVMHRQRVRYLADINFHFGHVKSAIVDK